MSISFKQLTKVIALVASTVLSVNTAQAAELKIQVFNPGEKSLFPVSSTLVTGPKEAVLIDAQFQRDDAQSVLRMIKDSGKELKTIYISHGDPDFYFGLDVITAAYPKAKVVTSPLSYKHIEETIEGKLGYWGPILGENAPQETIMPDILSGDTLTLDGESIKIIGLDGIDPKHTFVWIPSLKTVAGGVILYENVHVWMADNQTASSRDKWLTTLDGLASLNPKQIIPGHYIGKSTQDLSSVKFTQSYIREFEDAAIKAANSSELAESMKEAYPKFKNISDLVLSAKVIKGEMQW